MYDLISIYNKLLNALYILFSKHTSAKKRDEIKGVNQTWRNAYHARRKTATQQFCRVQQSKQAASACLAIRSKNEKNNKLESAGDNL